MTEGTQLIRGLEGVVAAETKLCDLDGTNGRLAYLTRLGDGMVPGPETVYQEGDLLHIALQREDLAIAERVLDAPPRAH